MAALGSGRSPDEAGGQRSDFSTTFIVRGGTGAVPSLVPLIPIGRGFDTPYRDACTIEGNALDAFRTISILRHDFPISQGVGPLPCFFKSAFVFFIYKFLYTLTIV